MSYATRHVIVVVVAARGVSNDSNVFSCATVSSLTSSRDSTLLLLDWGIVTLLLLVNGILWEQVLLVTECNWIVLTELLGCMAQELSLFFLSTLLSPLFALNFWAVTFLDFGFGVISYVVVLFRALNANIAYKCFLILGEFIALCCTLWNHCNELFCSIIIGMRNFWLILRLAHWLRDHRLASEDVVLSLKNRLQIFRTKLSGSIECSNHDTLLCGIGTCRFLLMIFAPITRDELRICLECTDLACSTHGLETDS